MWHPATGYNIMCCRPYFETIPGKLSSEFEQNSKNATTNLTDFSTREVWISTTLRNEVHGIGSYVQSGTPENHRAVPTSQAGCAVNPTLEAIHSAFALYNYNNTFTVPSFDEKTAQSLCSRSLNHSQGSAHVGVHSSEKPYRCFHPGCTKSFARNEELTRHKNIHTGTKPYVCGRCNKAFGRKDHLSKHEKTHLKASEKRMHRCYIVGCNHEYTRSDALARHLSTAHVASNKH